MRSVPILLRRWLIDALDVLLPTECAGCREPASTLCLPCRDQLHEQLSTPLLVSRFATALPLLPLRDGVAEQTEDGLPVLPVYAAGAYLDEVASVIWAIKEQARPQLAAHFGAGFSRAITAAVEHGRGQPAPLLVPIPATARSKHKRGYWPLQEFFRHATGHNNAYQLLESTPGLSTQHHKAHHSQKLRSKAARAAAVAGTLTLNPVLSVALKHRKVVLLDDVLTTGATLAEAYRILTRAGYQVVAAAVVAATLPAGRNTAETLKSAIG